MEKESINAVRQLIVIGGSAGSLDVILKAIAELDNAMNVPIVIALHRKNTTDNILAELLGSRTAHPVKEAEEKEPVMPGTIYLAPPDYHLLLEKDHSFSLDDSEKVNFSRPSIDIVFGSAAEVYGKNLTCILLSGANDDGVEGLALAKKLGGMAMAQNPDTAEFPMMPQQAILKVNIDRIFDGNRLGELLNSFKK